jgi:hypothetical protein
MTYRLVIASILLGLSAVAHARPPELKLPAFSHLQGRATESVNVTFGGLPLSIARWAFGKGDGDAETEEIRNVLKGLKSVSVCHYAFDSDFVYSPDDIDAVRLQLDNPAWSRIVQVRDRGKEESVDVYLALEGEKITGLAIVASEPREFTIVNIVGTFDLDQVDRLRAQFSPDRDFKTGFLGSASGL